MLAYIVNLSMHGKRRRQVTILLNLLCTLSNNSLSLE